MIDHDHCAPGCLPVRPLADDTDRLRRSMNRLYAICKAIAEKADEVAAVRCPYKDAGDRCTASFGCRNQSVTDNPAARPICMGSDKLNYRSTWDI